jgi:hypothetical protein
MLRAQLVTRLSLALTALVGLATGSRADIITIPQPTAAYEASTFKFAVPNSGPPIQSLTTDGVTITISAPMTPLQAGPPNFTWGHPPFVEDTSPAVLYSQQQTTRVLTFSEPLLTFGLEMVPNLTVFFPATLTVDFFSGNTDVETLRIGVRQFNARLFAAADPLLDTPFTSVRLTTPSNTFGFLIGDIRAAVVPEPSGLALFGLGLLATLGYGWRRRRAPVRGSVPPGGLPRLRRAGGRSSRAGTGKLWTAG